MFPLILAYRMFQVKKVMIFPRLNPLNHILGLRYYYFLETGNFFDDKDKMSDYQKLTKKDFLKKYDDETEHSYLNTAFIVKMKSSEKSKSHSEFNRE